MNLSKYFHRQFSYDAWANGQILAAIRTQRAEDRRSIQLLSHILAAERLWLERLQQHPQSTPVWPDRDLSQCETDAHEMSRLWNEYLDGITEDGLALRIHYTNSKGEPWESTVEDILTHVLLHSAYHRGQIASHLREIGQTPAYTDFIHGLRQGLF